MAELIGSILDVPDCLLETLAVDPIKNTRNAAMYHGINGVKRSNPDPRANLMFYKFFSSF